MEVKYNGETIGYIITNRSMTVEEALYCLGYDVSNQDDCRKAYENDFPGAYLGDCGFYYIDTENMALEG